jgi:tRNA(Arg) A34 adenosine deaminase TadA
MMRSIRIELPRWVAEITSGIHSCKSNEDKMRLAIALARENVVRGTGGPFGAAVFEQASGRVVGVGVNCVERAFNSVLHAEVMALMFAEAKVRSYSLRGGTLPTHVLVTTCEPCAMCLGAALWSGLTRILCGARRDDARSLGFEEGPVFPESYRYLEGRGLEIVRNVAGDEAREVLELYRQKGGTIYNG